MMSIIALTPEPAAKLARLEARVSEDQKELFARAAALQGRSLTDFIIASVHAAAVNVIKDSATLQLNVQESESFAEALLNPRLPSARLATAVKRHADLVG